MTRGPHVFNCRAAFVTCVILSPVLIRLRSARASVGSARAVEARSTRVPVLYLRESSQSTQHPQLNETAGVQVVHSSLELHPTGRALV
jgi:hypothetical protein